MKVLTQFPETGWCQSHNSEFINYLKNRYPNNEYVVDIKGNGFAWSSMGFWGIEIGSGKELFELRDLKQFFSRLLLKDCVPSRIYLFTNNVGTQYLGRTRNWDSDRNSIITYNFSKIYSFNNIKNGTEILNIFGKEYGGNLFSATIYEISEVKDDIKNIYCKAELDQTDSSLCSTNPCKEIIINLYVPRLTKREKLYERFPASYCNIFNDEITKQDKLLKRFNINPRRKQYLKRVKK
jgi:hypothetical protein